MKPEEEPIIRANFRLAMRPAIQRMEDKFIEKLRKDPTRSTHPWEEYPAPWLNHRLHQEIEEFDESESEEARADESIDIAIFALWYRLRVLL